MQQASDGRFVQACEPCLIKYGAGLKFLIASLGRIISWWRRCMYEFGFFINRLVGTDEYFPLSYPQASVSGD